MSDEIAASNSLVKSLNTSITELTNELATTRAEAKDKRIKGKQATVKLDEALKELENVRKQVDAAHLERDSFKDKLNASPHEYAVKLKDLENQIKTRDIKDLFSPLKEKLADGISLEDLFKIHEFNLDEVDSASIKVDELAKTWRDAKPGLFKTEGDPSAAADAAKAVAKAPLRVSEAAGRGGRDTSSPLTYRKSDVQTPGWDVKNKSLAEAIGNGTATLID